MRGIRRLAWLGALTIAMLAMAGGSAGAALLAPTSAKGVTEYTVEAKWIGALAPAGVESVTYESHLGTWEKLESRLGRVGPSGPLGESPAPSLNGTGVVTGTEGDTWTVTQDQDNQRWVSRQTSSGWSQIPGTIGATTVAPSAKGGVWFLQMELGETLAAADQRPKVGFVSADGSVTSFRLPNWEAGYQSIVEGKEGNAWFTEQFTHSIGRMTPSGELTEFPLASDADPVGITVDGEGNIWFSEQQRDRVGYITPAGKVTEFALPMPVGPTQLAAGADGRIWFTELVLFNETVSIGSLGRITPKGRFTQFELPDGESEPIDVTAGSEGAIWYSARGEHGCEGGGNSCMMWEPQNQAIVGRIVPTPLKPAVVTGKGTVGEHGIKVALACTGGKAWNKCHGRVTVKVGGKAVARGGYSLEADQAKQTVVPLLRGVRSPLDGKATRGATVSVALGSGGGARRGISLSRASKQS
jgi:streptogramin lyase